MMKLMPIYIKHCNVTKVTIALITLYLLAFSSLFTIVNNANANSNIVKWKDDKGVTHYGDKLPIQEAGRSNSVLSKQGTIIKTNNAFNENTGTKDVENNTSEQTRQDNALLASYSSVEEIELALNRNIKNDQITLGTLKQQLIETQNMLNKLNATYAGKKIPAYLMDDVKSYQAKIVKTKSDLAFTENSINETTTRFNNYKTRYLELKSRNSSLAK